MPSKFEKECTERFGVLSGQILVVLNEQKHIQTDITLLKADIGEIKDRIVNGRVNNATSIGETAIWTWIMRLGMSAIVVGLITKMFSLW